ncbi:MAG: hypothetical protein ACRDRO_11645 [Pseudonocardiaceae bacterium]
MTAQDELAAQYTVARAGLPDMEQVELVEVIMSRLDDDTILGLAAGMLGYWPAEPPGNRRDMAENEVLNFVTEMESGPEDDPE